MGEEFKIKTEVFEGPLDLLLHLIEKRKLHINDIALATVTDDFIAYLEREEDATMLHSTNFIWVASTLLLIKSRSLLPSLTLTEEEEGDIENLEYRLALYQKFKEIASSIIQIFGAQPLLKSETTPERQVVFAPDQSCSVPEFFAHADAVVKNLPQQASKPRVNIQKVISLEEMIERLSERISSSLSLSFKDFAGRTQKATPQETRVHVIVGFLAMLELVKRGILDVKQDAQFGDITMKTEQVGIPRYSN